MAGNDLSIEFMTPVGEKVPAPAPGREVTLAYCAREGGPYTGRISPALDGPFTAVAVICSRR
jgi:hypothetical protein